MILFLLFPFLVVVVVVGHNDGGLYFVPQFPQISFSFSISTPSRLPAASKSTTSQKDAHTGPALDSDLEFSGLIEDDQDGCFRRYEPPHQQPHLLWLPPRGSRLRLKKMEDL